MKWGVSVLIALVVGLAGGYGIRYASGPKAHSVTLPNGGRFNFNASGRSGFPGGFPGAGGFGATGKVASISGSTLEVQGSNGQTTVDVGSSATITKTVKTAVSSIAVGMCVTAIGKTNSIGTVTATRIMVSQPTANGCTPAFRGGGLPGGG